MKVLVFSPSELGDEQNPFFPQAMYGSRPKKAVVGNCTTVHLASLDGKVNIRPALIACDHGELCSQMLSSISLGTRYKNEPVPVEPHLGGSVAARISSMLL